jgi:hypothetical protein
VLPIQFLKDTEPSLYLVALPVRWPFLALVGGGAVIGAEEGGQVKAPVEMGLLHGIRQAFNIHDGLTQFNAI